MICKILIDKKLHAAVCVVGPAGEIRMRRGGTSLRHLWEVPLLMELGPTVGEEDEPATAEDEHR